MNRPIFSQKDLLSQRYLNNQKLQQIDSHMFPQLVIKLKEKKKKLTHI